MYHPDQLDRLLPSLPPTARAGGTTTGETGRGAARAPAAGAVPGGDGVEPPVRLDADGLAFWRGERFARKDAGVDRSRALYAIGDRLAKANASYSAIVAALAERDVTLGWHRYVDRPAEYERIADKVIAAAAAAVGAAAPEPAEPEPAPVAETTPAPPAAAGGTVEPDDAGCGMARLRQENRRLAARLTLIRQVNANPHLRPSEKVTAIGLILLLEHEPELLAPRPNGYYLLPIWALRKYTGRAPEPDQKKPDDADGENLQLFEKWGALERKVNRYQDEERRPRTEVLVKARSGRLHVVDLVAPIASCNPELVDPDRKRQGGHRPKTAEPPASAPDADAVPTAVPAVAPPEIPVCPDCSPEAPVVAVFYCGECDQKLGEGKLERRAPPAPPVPATSRIPQGKTPASSRNGHGPAETPEAPVLPVVVPPIAPPDAWPERLAAAAALIAGGHLERLTVNLEVSGATFPPASIRSMLPRWLAQASPPNPDPRALRLLAEAVAAIERVLAPAGPPGLAEAAGGDG